MASVSLSVFFLPKGRRQKEQRVSEDEMAGWHHRCNGHELGQISGDGEEQGGGLQSPGSQRVGYNWVTEQQQGFPLFASITCYLLLKVPAPYDLNSS